MLVAGRWGILSQPRTPLCPQKIRNERAWTVNPRKRHFRQDKCRVQRKWVFIPPASQPHNRVLAHLARE